MQNFLNGEFDPITYNIGFIQASSEAAIKAGMLRRSSSSYKRYSESYKDINIRQSINRLLPFGHRKYILLQTKSNWLCFLTNDSMHSDSIIARELNCPYFAITLAPFNHPLPNNKKDCGLFNFAYVSNHDTKGYGFSAPGNRCVYIDNEHERLRFKQEGEPLPFEQTEKYKSKNVRDRLTPEMIQNYCHALGIRIFDEDFYGPECHVLYPKFGFFNPPPEKGYGWEELRRRHGLSPVAPK